jgi:hypothetical protein
MVTRHSREARVVPGARTPRSSPSPSSLPTFLIVGAMRSGTTSLARYLGAHPDIRIAPEKEVHFFDLNFDRGLDWYCGRLDGSESAACVGEATPSYMYDKSSVERMVKTLPRVKLIAILRDPIDRAYSHFQLNKALGIEPMSFQQALRAEAERLGSHDHDQRFAYSYVDRGMYHAQLSRLSRRFPRESIHVALFEEMRADPEDVVEAACRFLGVDPSLQPPGLGRIINPHVEFRSLRLRRLTKRLPQPVRTVVGSLNARPTAYGPLDAITRMELHDVFRSDVEDLSRYLGRELPWLTSPMAGAR